MPLRAIDAAAKEYISYEVAEDVRNINLFCPACKGKMSWVNCSPYKINHFRHTDLCTYETEPETEEHIAMKKGMLQLLLKIPNMIDVSVEKVIFGKDNQRRIADLYGKHRNGRQFVIECQCSSLPIDTLIDRTEFYASNGIYVLWVLGYDNFFKFESGILKSTEIERWLVERYKQGLYYYDIKTGILSYVFYFWYGQMSRNKAISSIKQVDNFSSSLMAKANYYWNCKDKLRLFWRNPK